MHMELSFFLQKKNKKTTTNEPKNLFPDFYRLCCDNFQTFLFNIVDFLYE